MELKCIIGNERCQCRKTGSIPDRFLLIGVFFLFLHILASIRSTRIGPRYQGRFESNIQTSNVLIIDINPGRGTTQTLSERWRGSYTTSSLVTCSSSYWAKKCWRSFWIIEYIKEWLRILWRLEDEEGELKKWRRTREDVQEVFENSQLRQLMIDDITCDLTEGFLR